MFLWVNSINYLADSDNDDACKTIRYKKKSIKFAKSSIVNEADKTTLSDSGSMSVTLTVDGCLKKLFLND